MVKKIRQKFNMKEKNNKNKISKVIDYVIIGNSAAGLAAAESIRKVDRKGKIVLLTEEDCKNYSKPLITYYLEGLVDLAGIHFKGKDFYRDNNIDIHLNTRVTSVVADKKFLTCSNGDTYRYNKLLITSGGKPIIPEIKVTHTDLAGSRQDKKVSLLTSINKENYRDVRGIFTLTTLSDAIEIKNFIGKNNIKKVSILGGGLIGLKSAEAFLGMGVGINIIELADRILAATFDGEASYIIENRITSRGSSIYKNNTIKEIFVNKDGRIAGYRLKDGSEEECSLLIMAIGVRPDTGFIKDNSVEIKKGIVVDNYMRTTNENIFAAGDVVEAMDMLLNENRSIAIWPLAVRQGAVAGVNMAGGSEKYGGGFFMNSVEILGIPTISMGLAGIGKEHDKNIEVFKLFNREENRYKKVVIRNDRVAGLIMVGNIERAGIYAGLIKNEIDISSIKDNISREDFGIINLPGDYKKHLVTGEGIEV